MSKQIVFLGMGGTIAGTAASASDNVGYRAGQVAVSQLLGQIPGLQTALAGDDAVSEQVAQLDSKDMDYAHWESLARKLDAHLRRPEVRAVVVTHGTDTLEETAFFLASVLEPSLLAHKPVVMTCAMRPASAHVPDGPQNLMDAVAVARGEGVQGVVVVCGGVVHGARDVQKVHPYRLNPFDSGDAGALAYVEQGRLRQVRPWASAAPAQHFTLPAAPRWPRVELLVSHAGASGAVVNALLAADTVRLHGLVIAGTGNGTVHAELEAALRDAEGRGVRVVRASRCAYGAIVDAEEAGAERSAFAHYAGLSPLKSRIALTLELLSA